MKLQCGVIAVMLLGGGTPAFAYVDPGTGSMLLQVILGGIAAAGVALKLFWHKIRAALSTTKKPVSGDEAD